MHALPEDVHALHEVFSAIPISVVFADAAAIARARDAGAARIPLVAPFHVSGDDVYLVLPDDIGLGLVDIFRDGDAELLVRALRDGLLVLGSIERDGPGLVFLDVDEASPAGPMLASMPYASEVPVGDRADAVDALNALEQAQVTVASDLVDATGLEVMLAAAQHIGKSWRVPAGAKHLGEVDPTYAWSCRLPDGRVGIEAVLFQEYEELVVLLRPAALVMAGPALVVPS
jgi:hypothetical protein